MTVHYPLLVSAGDQTPGEPVSVGSGAACYDYEASPATVDIDPSGIIAGLEDGDFVVLVLCGNGTTAGRCPLVPPSVDSGWTAVQALADSSTGVNRYGGVLCGFWDSASPETAFRVSRFSSTGTVCVTAHAWRGVSRRKPIDCRGGIVHPSGNGTSPYWPAVRPHQSATGVDSIPMFYLAQWQSSTSGNPFATTDDTVLTSCTLRDYRTQKGGNQHHAAITLMARQGALQNLLGSVYDVLDTNSTPGLASSGLDWDDGSPTTTTYNTYEFFTPDRTVTEQKKLSASISAAAGDVIVWSYNSSDFVSIFSADYNVVLSISDPSGNTYSRGFVQEAVTTEWDADFDARPDSIFRGGSGNSWGVGMDGLLLVAPENGTYTLTAYQVREGNPLSWQYSASGSGEASIRTRYCGGGVALNACPFWQGTFTGESGEFSYDDYIPPLAILNADQTYTPDGAYITHAYEICLSDTTFRASRMVQDPEVPVVWEDTDQLTFANTGQLRQALSNQLNSCSDSIALPTYRTTEGGSDVAGKYYFEVVVPEPLGTNSCLWGLGLNGAQWNSYQVNAIASNAAQFIVHMTSQGDVREGVGSGGVADTLTLSSGDVLGIALDIQAGTCGVYQNGALQVTIDVDTETADADERLLLKTGAYKIYHSARGQTTSDFERFRFNLRGPFTYSKPTGYVAWDWHSEEA